MRTRLLDGAEAGVTVVGGCGGGVISFLDLQFKVFRVLPAETPLAVVAVALSPLSPAAVTHSLHPFNPIKPSNALYEFGGILKKKKNPCVASRNGSCVFPSAGPVSCGPLWSQSLAAFVHHQSHIYCSSSVGRGQKPRVDYTKRLCINIIFYPLDTKSVSRCPEPSNPPFFAFASERGRL